MLSVIAELADVMRSIAFGPPARPIAYRDVKPAAAPRVIVGGFEFAADAPELAVMAANDRAAAESVRAPRRYTLIAPARARLDADILAAVERANDRAIAWLNDSIIEALCPPGLVPCPTCGTEQAPRDGRMAVHFATHEATRPCTGSWPVKVVPR